MVLLHFHAFLLYEQYQAFMYIYLLALCYSFFFFGDTMPSEFYTLSLHDALPISTRRDSGRSRAGTCSARRRRRSSRVRSEEHTSELQSPCNLVCRLLLVKKKYQAFM